jgi:hypothetical protein
MWEFLKWFFAEFLEKIGFNGVMLAILKSPNLSKAARFNLIAELIIATLILIYAVIIALKNSSTKDILVGIDRFLISALICALFVISEKFWR